MSSRFFSYNSSTSTGTGTGYTEVTSSCALGLNTIEATDMSGSYLALYEYYLTSGSTARAGLVHALYMSSSAGGASASYQDSGPADIGSFPTASVYVEASSSYLNFIVSSSVAAMSATVNRITF